MYPAMPAPSDLAAVISQVESGDNPYRLRFEPAIFARWATPNATELQIMGRIQQIHDCSRDTARMIAATSWGRYQILGENLYDFVCGLQTDVFSFVEDDEAQAACFEAFIRNRGVAFTLEQIEADRTMREQFIATYNGPSDVDVYWGRMQAAIKALAATS